MHRRPHASVQRIKISHMSERSEEGTGARPEGLEGRELAWSRDSANRSPSYARGPVLIESRGGVDSLLLESR